MRHSVTTEPAGRKLPPSVSGNVRELSRDPLRFFLMLARDYGDIVQYRATPEPAFLINHPDYVRHVLQDNGRNYNKDTYLIQSVMAVVTRSGLLTSENPLWRRQRRLMQPAFHRRNLIKFAPMIVEASNEMLARWEHLAAEGQPVDVANEIMRLTMNIVTRSLFSYDIGEQMDRVSEAVNVLAQLPKPRHRRFKEAHQVMDEVVYGIIEKRRQAGGNDLPGDDLLSTLLQARDEETGEGMSNDQVRDEVMSLLVAGHETTASGLSWLWYALAQHPNVVERLEAELAAVLQGRLPTAADLPRLRYTQMVFSETLRLYPPAWSMSRRALADDEIGSYFIPANAVIAISPYTMHRHPAFWPEPERFNPERFTPQQSAERPRFAYFPFGGGARQCIGDQFALIEAALVIATVAPRFRLHLVPDHPVESFALVTLRPRHGLLMTLEKR